MTDEQQFYTVEEVANYFRVHNMTVRDWVKAGTLRGFKAGRDWRFTKQNMEDCAVALQKLTDEKMRKIEARQPGILELIAQECKYFPADEQEAINRWLVEHLEQTGFKAYMSEHGLVIASLTHGEPVTVHIDEEKRAEIETAAAAGRR
jgi:excisionase family DNA binding protein